MTFVITEGLKTCSSSFYQFPFGHTCEQISVCTQLRLSITQKKKKNLGAAIRSDSSGEVCSGLRVCFHVPHVGAITGQIVRPDTDLADWCVIVQKGL